MDETSPIAPKARADDGTDSQAVYYGEGQSPKQRLMQVLCTAIVILSVLVSLSLCIYQGVRKKISHVAFCYFMFAVTLFGVAAVHLVMVLFMKKGYISEGKMWFSYVSSLFLVVQSIFIDIIVFS